MKFKVDILENDIHNEYPGVLETLLKDHTTQKNIIWATSNYKYLGNGYGYSSNIETEYITGKNGQIVMPRVKKKNYLQLSRSKEMAEVFTPSWVCNAQINLIDSQWFDKENVFNYEIYSSEKKTWRENQKKIEFPNGKTWKDYVKENRLEITCGEAPYITSRYDSTNGKFIELNRRIGMLDRKLRVINENVDKSDLWLKATQDAYKSIYAFEWQGDSLLLAREAMLITFIENYYYKFGKLPLLKSVKYIAYIISWNVWQMDGLKFVVPNSCMSKTNNIDSIFGDTESQTINCEGCKTDDVNKHNGVYCLIKDWYKKDKTTNKKGIKTKFLNIYNKVK